MIIERVDDGDILFPRCPDCGVPLYQESEELGNEQKAQKKRWDECDHEYPSTGDWYSDWHSACEKCGYCFGVSHVPTARLMRCPKCAALYHVE
jgi:hypothetical protein